MHILSDYAGSVLKGCEPLLVLGLRIGFESWIVDMIDVEVYKSEESLHNLIKSPRDVFHDGVSETARPRLCEERRHCLDQALSFCLP